MANLNFRQMPLVTYTLIGLCVAIYIFIEATRLPQIDDFALYLSIHPKFHYWQYLTSLFLHGSWAHLLLNMLGLWMFGSALEYLWGGAKFLVFYLLCGIGAGIIYDWINLYQFQGLTQNLEALGLSPADLNRLLTQRLYRSNIIGLTPELVRQYYDFYSTITLGASGAIYGVLVAYAFCFPRQKLIFLFFPIPIAAKYFVAIILLIELGAGMTGYSLWGVNIAHFAHVAGGLVGGVLVFLFGRGQGDYR